MPCEKDHYSPTFRWARACRQRLKCDVSSTEAQRGFGVLVQTAQEGLVADDRGVGGVATTKTSVMKDQDPEDPCVPSIERVDLQYLGQSDLPRRIALELDARPKQNQQVRLAHDALGDLGVNQLHADVRGRQLLLLRHFGQRLGQVNERATPILGAEQQDRQVRQRAAASGIGVRGRGRRVLGGCRGWAKGRQVGRAQGQSGLLGGAEVGLEGARDAAMGRGEVVFQDSCGARCC